MGTVSVDHKSGHIYLQQDISGELAKVLAGSKHDSVDTFLEHLFDLYTKASKTTQSVVVREDVAQKFTALQCETRFQTSDDLMKHLLHLHVEYLKTANNDIIAKQTPRERSNPRKSRKSQPKRNIKHSAVAESDESCDLIATDGNDDPWSDKSAVSGVGEAAERTVDLSRVKEEIVETDKVIKVEQADKASLIKRIFHNREGVESSGIGSINVESESQRGTRSRNCRSATTVTNSSKKKTRLQTVNAQKKRVRMTKSKVTAGPDKEKDEDDAGLEEETRIACVNIENVAGEVNESGAICPEVNRDGHSFSYDSNSKQGFINDPGLNKAKSKPLQSPRQTRYTYDCFKCKKKFKNRAPLNLHIAVEHRDDAPNGILCSLCGKLADYDHEQMLHEKFFCRKVTRRFKCPQCHLNFAEDSERDSHPCSKDPAKPFYCSVSGCDTYSRNARDLTEHVTRHLGIKPFLCNICGRAFSAKKDMDRHADTHKDSKDYTCQECGTSYRSYHTLRRHMSSHKFKDRYKCNECSYTTALKHSYNQHMIKHSQYTNQCQICKKKLRSKRSLEKHIQNRHTFNRIFTCRYCDFSTDIGLSYSSHMRHHKNAKSSNIPTRESNSHETELNLTEMDNCSVQHNTSNDVNSLQLVATKLVSSVASDFALSSVCSSSNASMLAEAAILENMDVSISGKNVDTIMANIVAASDTSELAVIAPESSNSNLIIYDMDPQSTSLNMPGFVTDSIASDRESWGNTSEGSSTIKY